MIDDEASNIWSSKAGISPFGWSPSRTFEMAMWTRRMSREQVNTLKATIQQWQQFGKWYKKRFDFNQKWMRSVENSIDVDAWLVPKPKRITFHGKQVTLMASLNPIEIFMMGTYFNTCLSQNGCNEDAVITNAVEANKHVVYAKLDDGTVIGRQLFAINTANRLIGFCCYANFDGTWPKDMSSKHDPLIVEFAKYAAMIGCNANIEIESESLDDVAELSGRFWYDDGIHDWHASIKAESERLRELKAHEAGQQEEIEVGLSARSANLRTYMSL